MVEKTYERVPDTMRPGQDGNGKTSMVAVARRDDEAAVASRCGSASFDDLKRSHPCFGDHRATTGRIHLPVCAKCNIGCRFCERALNDDENRPGVASKILSPEEAVDVLDKAIDICPEIAVAGIAGPGDSLVGDNTIDTFKLVKERHPELFRCMSTNGLLLAEKADQILEVGIDSLTVTVNAVDPQIEAKINRGIHYHGKWIPGVEGAKILIANQLEGISRLADAGVTIKVNFVLIPGVNDEHVASVAREVARRGARMFNVIPLIPQGDFKDVKAPDCGELMYARLCAELYIDVFCHCQHCRADAIGVPGGKDYGEQLYGGRIACKDTFSHG